MNRSCQSYDLLGAEECLVSEVIQTVLKRVTFLLSFVYGTYFQGFEPCTQCSLLYILERKVFNKLKLFNL